jgi:hypothetical protein
MTNYPVYVWVLVLAGVVGLPAVTTVGLYRAMARGAFASVRSLAALTWPQSIRVVGVVFVIAFAMGRLPAVFALRLGDLAVGIAASWPASNRTGCWPSHHPQWTLVCCRSC